MQQYLHKPGRQAPCPRPFEWCEIHPNGSVFLCCPAWLKRPAGNLLEQTIPEIWNSPNALEIRKSILNGSYHNCNRRNCPRLAHATTDSVEDASAGAREAIARESVQLETLPVRLNLCFDQSCNLACPSCRPQHLISTGEDRQRAEKIAEIVWQHLLPTAEQLTLSGYGDPFGSPVYFNLLKRINPHSCPQLEDVRLHTNGLLFDEHHWRQLTELPPLLRAVEVSIDAAKAETYWKNRGGDFSRLLENLEFIAGLQVPLRLSMVVQENNFREIILLQNLALKFDADIYLSRLVNWGTFSRQELKTRDVCALSHPSHQELLQILQKSTKNPRVDYGNLRQLLTS